MAEWSMDLGVEMVDNEDSFGSENMIKVLTVVVEGERVANRKETQVSRCLMNTEGCANKVGEMVLRNGGVPPSIYQSSLMIWEVTNAVLSMPQNVHNLVLYFVIIDDKENTPSSTWCFLIQSYKEKELHEIQAIVPFVSAVRKRIAMAKRVENKEARVCSICLEDIVIGNEIEDGSGIEAACLPCTHYYHRSCIIKWLNNHDSCPLCRFKLT